MSVPLIEVKHLKKYFKTPAGSLHAVDDISFNLEAGKTLGVVGESGCGKSTLGRTLIRLHEATGGDILYNGKSILKLNARQRLIMCANMQIVFQDPYASLDPRMTIGNIIREQLTTFGMAKGKAELDHKTEELMDSVGLPMRYINAYPHELDGGRRQRVGIARALAPTPQFIVCDEPVSALDVSIQAQILNLMMDLQKEKGIAYLFITHNLSVVKHISNDIMVMYMGTMVEYAQTEELFANPVHPYTKGLLSAIPMPDLSARGRERILLKGEVTSPVNLKPGCRFAPRCQYATEKCTSADIEPREISPGHWVSCII
ncbi:peptide ABC transporter ATP-binding protein [Clostridium sp. chh4-2]|uniref:ABC transporter ATP-binding protein n=1 Tax=Clostridium sp. chh4-2 TaxID=2067550 RepID=UPI000CCF16F6|nr:ABC transporter ATP-binding protein [Clostridium sp. chh4-2]PNV63555.1 peptide ABC transporter ATP-binding protein [Clostridium sp. chh4-2]